MNDKLDPILEGVNLEKLRDEELQEYGFRLFCKGYTLTEIGQQLNRSVSRVSRWKANNKWEDRSQALTVPGDPGSEVLALLEQPMEPEELNFKLKLLVSRLLQRANESLEAHELDFKNVYHFKALVETLKVLQEAERLANDMANEIKEVRHVHILDADLRTQLAWVQAAIDDGVDTDVITIPTTVGGDDE